jgi:hypothetical protein
LDEVRPGKADVMDRTHRQRPQDSTAPGSRTGPAANPEVDRDAVATGVYRWEQASGGTPEGDPDLNGQALARSLAGLERATGAH